MRRQTLIHVLIYGVTGGVLIAILKLIEFRFIVVEHSIEIYGALIAALFAAFGIWLGLKLTRKEEVLLLKEVVKEVPVPMPAAAPFTVNEEQQRQLGITKRELEILELIAQGLSNREIADKLSSAKTQSRPTRAGSSTSSALNGAHKPYKSAKRSV